MGIQRLGHGYGAAQPLVAGRCFLHEALQFDHITGMLLEQ
jgi:hypothetical protein